MYESGLSNDELLHAKEVFVRSQSRRIRQWFREVQVANGLAEQAALRHGRAGTGSFFGIADQ